MKGVTVGVGLALCVGLAMAREPVPQGQAQEAARLLAGQAAKATDLPVKPDVDPEKPYGLKEGMVAALVIPDKGLTAEKVGQAGQGVLPVGQLWLRGLTPVVAGEATPGDKLRLIKVTVKNEDHELPLLLLGARKGAGGKPELLVYARGKEPLLTLPLEAADRNQEQPIELEGEKGENERGTLVLHVAGKYRARLPLAKAP